MSLLELFCNVDDFCLTITDLSDSQLLGSSTKPGPKLELSASKIMTIIIHFHSAQYRNFKAYYTTHVMRHLRSEFPKLVSYNRFVELMPLVLVPLCLYLHTRFGPVTDISFIDSTPLPVCHNRRIDRHKVFAGLAAIGKTSMGWFFGFKLHLVVKDQGDLLAFYLTPGNVDDRKPVPRLTERLFGKLFGDKGYISQPLAEQLLENDVQLITGIRKNMQNKLMPAQAKKVAQSQNEQLHQLYFSRQSPGSSYNVERHRAGRRPNHGRPAPGYPASLRLVR